MIKGAAPTTMAGFKADVVKQIKLQDKTLKVTWKSAKRVTWFDGSKGFIGFITVTAKDGRSQDAVAQFREAGEFSRASLSVR